ncbi:MULTISPECIES: dicarboxylate/amino acid:cation symporter [Corynebacterium]|uniref:Dicarboxylate/amino acid:cation symporter n=1 Tax=Corynebacterium gottingense TaxID=2041036 RepID=A0ABX9UIP6_9CORY|nr:MULTISPECIES: dicarboxylate/amino acid:cation symporter [Corynebacterium]PAT12542.1 sodium:proton antiporter [Corynebacterium hadale]RMD18898.1 dicarboxylate/amino acid:cation symporter [Corynebacterium gottingense]WJZ12044.1 Proton glutamate symport protein [Corynebacterium gottingense]WJZ14365.1 Proton glutamate symport protein [Corynebacterium gottingense]
MSLPKWATGFGAQVIYGLIIGLILGFIAAGSDVEWLSGLLDWVGGTYVQLLKLLIPPLVFTAVVTSIANLRQVSNAARLAVQTLVWFAITAFFSVIIGIVVGAVLKPGANSTVDAAEAAEPSTTGSWMGFLDSVVPSNFLGLTAKVTESGASVNFNVLQILVVSLLIGVAAVKAGKSAEPFIKFSESLLKVVQVVLWWVIRLAPIGTAALIGNAVATYGWEALSNLGQFVLAIYIGLALVIFVLYPIVLAMNKINVVEFFQRVWPVTALGFVTRSSMGVMPVNQRTVEQSMGVPSEYASFAMPLGAATKMDGCASVYPAIAALFVAQFYGVDLGMMDYLLIVIVSVLGSAATAGTTGATVMLTLTLSTLGLPLAGVGLLLAIEPIIDMGRTAVNVTGQAVVAAVVSTREKILDKDVWDAGKEAAPAAA